MPSQHQTEALWQLLAAELRKDWNPNYWTWKPIFLKQGLTLVHWTHFAAKFYKHWSYLWLFCLSVTLDNLLQTVSSLCRINSQNMNWQLSTHSFILILTIVKSFRTWPSKVILKTFSINCFDFTCNQLLVYGNRKLQIPFSSNLSPPVTSVHSCLELQSVFSCLVFWHGNTSLFWLVNKNSTLPFPSS